MYGVRVFVCVRVCVQNICAVVIFSDLCALIGSNMKQLHDSCLISDFSLSSLFSSCVDFGMVYSLVACVSINLIRFFSVQYEYLLWMFFFVSFSCAFSAILKILHFALG